MSDTISAVGSVPAASSDHTGSDAASGRVRSVRLPPSTPAATPRLTARRYAVEELLTALDALVRRHTALPPDERDSRLSAEAERITAEVARHLARARAELERRPLPCPAVVDTRLDSAA